MKVYIYRVDNSWVIDSKLPSFVGGGAWFDVDMAIMNVETTEHGVLDIPSHRQTLKAVL